MVHRTRRDKINPGGPNDRGCRDPKTLAPAPTAARVAHSQAMDLDETLEPDEVR